MKKGQLTTFIIVGIVILFIGAFAIYIMSVIRNQEPVIQNDDAKAGLRKCLQQSAELALEQVASQGGTTTGLAGHSADVALGKIRIGVTQVPEKIIPQTYNPLQLWLGALQFEPLCLRNGPNRPNGSINDCMAGTYQLLQPNKDVIQYELAQLTSANFAICGLNATAVVTFGDSDVTVESANISVQIPIRFKRVFNTAQYLALKDVKEIMYDKRTIQSIPGCYVPGFGNECLLPGMAIHAYRENTVTVIEISDAAKKLRGKPFTYRYLIENRHPAIVKFWLPPETSMDSDSTKIITVLQSVDPDEDETLTVDCRLVDSSYLPVDPLIATVTCNPGIENYHETNTTIDMSAACSTSPYDVLIDYKITDSSGAFNNFKIPVHIVEKPLC